MLNAKSVGTDNVSSSFSARTGASEGMQAGGVFHVQCLDKNGNLKWETTKHNLVVNQGLQDMNAKYFKGAAYTAAWFLGLVTGPGSSTTFAADLNPSGNNPSYTRIVFSPSRLISFTLTP